MNLHITLTEKQAELIEDLINDNIYGCDYDYYDDAEKLFQVLQQIRDARKNKV